MTAAQMRAFGMQALTKGYADQALAIAEALLARDAGDSAGLVLRAQALRVLYRLPESETAARASWAAAKDPGGRHVAARPPWRRPCRCGGVAGRRNCGCAVRCRPP